MPGMTNCLVGSGQEKYSFASGVLVTTSTNLTFDETTFLTTIRAGLKNLATNYGAKFYGIVESDNKYIWAEYTAENLPINISNENNRLTLILGMDKDVQLVSVLLGSPTFKCEFTKKFPAADVPLLINSSNTTEVYLTVIGGAISERLGHSTETSPWIGLRYSD